MAFALMAEQADHLDRLAVSAGVSEPPQARQQLEERLSFAPDVPTVEETNVVELAAFVERVNRSL